MTQTLRQTAAAKVNDALVELAREHAKNGRYNEARSLLQEAIAQNKSHAGAQKLLRELDDPDRVRTAGPVALQLPELVQRLHHGAGKPDRRHVRIGLAGTLAVAMRQHDTTMTAPARARKA